MFSWPVGHGGAAAARNGVRHEMCTDGGVVDACEQEDVVVVVAAPLPPCERVVRAVHESGGATGRGRRGPWAAWEAPRVRV